MEVSWTERAQTYGNLEWAHCELYWREILVAGQFSSDHTVLDLGTGTGQVAHTLAPLVHGVVGVDSSPAMLNHARKDSQVNESFLLGNAYRLGLKDNCFDCVTARMVFHHLVQDPQKALGECHRVLRSGGLMVVAEGVPPHPSLRQWYGEMFALKETRLVFMEEDLETLLVNGGFEDVQVHLHTLPHMSVKNWLRNGGLDQEVQDRIYEMHLNLTPGQRQHYGAIQLKNDMLLNFKNAVVTGRKHA